MARNPAVDLARNRSAIPSPYRAVKPPTFCAQLSRAAHHVHEAQALRLSGAQGSTRGRHSV
eukprot:308586-Prymnesium_polylepis.1